MSVNKDKKGIIGHLWDNRKWIFSGIGVTALVSIVAIFFHEKQRKSSIINIDPNQGSEVAITVDQSEHKGLTGKEVSEIVERMTMKYQEEIKALHGELSNAKKETGQLERELEKASDRIRQLEAQGDLPDSNEARESDDIILLQDMKLSQESLMKYSSTYRNLLIESNQKIAALAYLRGDIDVAEAAVDEVLKLEPNNEVALNQRGSIYILQGKFKEAERVYLRIKELGVEKNNKQWQAEALGNLGIIYQTKGQFDKAEEMFREGLKIDKKLGRLEGLASNYGNLGLIYQIKGEFDKAEEMLNESLEIEMKLGRLKGMASACGNLGLIYRTKGEFDKAEEMFLQIVEIHTKIGNQEGLAKDYGNLGGIYQTKGELDKAEAMFLKGLKIDKELGRLEGIASKYGNLGLIYQTRGNIEKAKEYWGKSRELYKKIGMPHMEKKMQMRIERNLKFKMQN